MSKVKDTYRVHDNIESARQFEMKHTGRSYWSREEPPPAPQLQPILIKCILLIAAFLLPVLLTLLSFKFIYRAFIVGVLLFLSVETNAQPVQRAKVSGIEFLLAGGAIYGYLAKHKKFAPCKKRGPFRLWRYYSAKNFNPIHK